MSTKEKKKKTDLAAYMSRVILRLKEEKKYAAKHTYTATLHSFTEFSGGAGTPMPVATVFTPVRLKAYETWLRSREKSWNTVSTYMRTLQAVYNRLYPPGSAGHNPILFRDVYTKVESQTKRALTEEQMQTLTGAGLRLLTGKGKTEEQKDKREKKKAQPQRVSQSPEQSCQAVPQGLRRPLAYFLLMFFLRGMPFIDLAYLRKSDVKGNLLVYHRHKTGRRMTVQITPEAVKLLDECRDRNKASPYLFPVLDATLTDEAEVYRSYLKELRRFNSQLRALSKVLLGGAVKISSYTARHSWATLMYHMGIPVGIICEALGHSSIRVTETYLKPFGNEKVDKANRKLINAVMKTDRIYRNRYNTL